MNRTNQYSISKKINLIFDKDIKPDKISYVLYSVAHTSS